MRVGLPRTIATVTAPGAVGAGARRYAAAYGRRTGAMTARAGTGEGRSPGLLTGRAGRPGISLGIGAVMPSAWADRPTGAMWGGPVGLRGVVARGRFLAVRRVGSRSVPP